MCDQRIDTATRSGCVCSTCRGELTSDSAATCPRCAETVGPHTDTTAGCMNCRSRRFSFAGAVRLGAYQGKLRDAVLLAKHEGGEPLAEELGALLGTTRTAPLNAVAAEAVVPVPLHWQRRWARGYNQSEAVARGLAHVLGLPCRPRWLIRTRPTAQQRLVSAAARWENVRGAFRTGFGVRVRGVRILLVDDVLTTGATVDAAAAALMSAGAAQVSVAVIAHR